MCGMIMIERDIGSLVLTVDQANDEHEAKLVFASNNSDPIYLTVTFTPSANAPQAIKDNAVPSELYFTTSTEMQYTMDADGNYSATGTAKKIFTPKLKLEAQKKANPFSLHKA